MTLLTSLSDEYILRENASEIVRAKCAFAGHQIDRFRLNEYNYNVFLYLQQDEVFCYERLYYSSRSC